MDPRDFLQVAGRLTLASGSTAADYRTAISRAYYGVYHLARQLLNDRLQFFCNVDNEHLWVQRHYYNCQMKAAKEIGRPLGNLHEARKNADYDLDDPGIETSAAARFQLERARAIQSSIQTCIDPANIETLKTEMTAYRAKANLR